MKKLLVLLLVAALGATALAAPGYAAKKKKGCKAYKAGEMGAEAETTKITDKAT